MPERRYLESGRYEARQLYQEIGVCEQCHEQQALDRHHKDGDTHNNSRGNISFLCRHCHMEEDGRLLKLRESRPEPITHCKAGHLFDEQNTRWHKGKRHCRRCHADRAKKYKLKKRDERRRLPGQWRGGRWWPDESYEKFIEYAQTRKRVGQRWV